MTERDDAPMAVGPVAAAGSAENEAKLAAAIAALEKDGFSGYYPAPAFGADTNLNTMIEARLEKLGVTGVVSHVVSSGMEKYEPAARGSIDTTGRRLQRQYRVLLLAARGAHEQHRLHGAASFSAHVSADLR